MYYNRVVVQIGVPHPPAPSPRGGGEGAGGCAPCTPLCGGFRPHAPARGAPHTSQGECPTPRKGSAPHLAGGVPHTPQGARPTPRAPRRGSAPHLTGGAPHTPQGECPTPRRWSSPHPVRQHVPEQQRPIPAGQRIARPCAAVSPNTQDRQKTLAVFSEMYYNK